MLSALGWTFLFAGVLPVVFAASATEALIDKIIPAHINPITACLMLFSFSCIGNCENLAQDRGKNQQIQFSLFSPNDGYNKMLLYGSRKPFFIQFSRGCGMRFAQVTVKSCWLVVFLAISAVSPLTLGDTVRMKVSFPGYTGNETLTNFPVLVILSTNIENFSYQQFAAPATGWDLRFAASNEILELNYEIEEWNTNGASCVWVQVPELAGTNTCIWAYWGNSADTNPPAYTTDGSTWTNSYSGVWHLTEDAGSARNDSTGNNNDATPNLTYGSNPGSTAGRIGNCNLFSGANSLGVSNSASLSTAVTTGLTVSAWIRSKVDLLAGASSYRVMEKDNCYFLLQGTPSGGMAFLVKRSSNNFAAEHTMSLNSNQWYLVTGTFNGTTASTYIDGVLKGSVNVGGAIDSSAGILRIGSDYVDPPGAYFNGEIDEVRISKTGRSSNWIWNCWLNQASNSVFNAYDSAMYNSFPFIIHAGAASNITLNSAMVSGTLLSTGASPCSVRVCLGNSDGGTNASLWAMTNYFGTNLAVTPVTFSTNITGLNANTNYYYRFNAENTNGVSWAAYSGVFITGEINLNVVNTNLAEGQPDQAMITFSRPAAAAGSQLTVNYTLGGTAGNGLDYAALGGSIVMTAGATTTNIVITPIDDDTWMENDETVTVTLAPGGYMIGSQSNAAVTISDNDVSGAWLYRMRLTFSGYNMGETLTNFPALVVLNTNIQDFSYSLFKDPVNGNDLRFADSSGTTALNYEVEEWNTNGNSYIWVQVPKLAGPTTYIWAYFSNPDATNRPAYALNGSTWSDGFRGVWHFGQTNGTENLADSSPNRYNGTDHGINEGSSSVVGRVSYAQEFTPANSNYISLVSSSLLLPVTNNPVTFSCWMKPATIVTSSTDNRLISVYGANNPSTALTLACGSTNRLQIYYIGPGTTGTLTSASLVNTGNWYHAAVSYDGQTFSLYLNGGLTASVAANLNAGAAFITRLGTFNSDRYFDGVMDEARIYSYGCSANWIWACYMNEGFNSSFISYGKATRSFGTVIMIQ